MRRWPRFQTRNLLVVLLGVAFAVCFLMTDYVLVDGDLRKGIWPALALLFFALSRIVLEGGPNERF
jgi:hypothetical protein